MTGKINGPADNRPQAEEFNRLLEATSVIPWEADAQTWLFTYIGPQVEALLGYPQERWYEKDFWLSHLYPDDRDFAAGFCETSSRALDNFEFEYRMIAADGRSIWLSDVVNVVRKDGKPHLLRGFLKDISERKELEADLRKARDELEEAVMLRTVDLEKSLGRYRALCNAVPDLVLRMDSNNRYLDFHSGDQVKLTHTPEEFIGRTPSDLYDPEFAKAAEGYIQKALETGEMQVWEYEIGFNGEAQYFEGRFVPSTGNEVVVFIRDISDARRTQERLRLSESRLLEAQRIARIGSWEWNAATDELWWSEETYRLFGLEPGTPVNYSRYIETIHPEDREQEARLVRDALEARRPYSTRFRVLLPDGTVRVIDSQAELFPDKQGRMTRWVGFDQDVTELMELNAKLEEQNAELAIRDQNKEQLLATLGHEIRNPLAVIKNSVELMALQPPGAAGDRERELSFEVLRRQTDHMQSIVDDLLNLERIKYGKIDLQLESVDLGELTREVVDLRRGQAEDAGLSLELALPEDPIHVRADRARLRQILENLLENSLRFTDDGTITISVRKDATNAEIAVTDTGIGIAPSEADSIFEPFYQGSRDRTDAAGLGFGLTLVKRLVEMHGGMVNALSAGPGTGTTFVFTLPLAQAESDKAPELPLRTKRRHRILVVDDERDIANSFAKILGLLGHEAEIAYNGASALEIASTQRPDIVFLDLSMPGMGGREVARCLREKFSSSELEIVALTGLMQSGESVDGEDPDFSHYLLKPASLKEVVDLLNSI